MGCESKESIAFEVPEHADKWWNPGYESVGDEVKLRLAIDGLPLGVGDLDV